jgi:hypothetical protein
VILRAGYQTGAFGTIFDGFVTYYKQGRDPGLTETYLHITAQTDDIAANRAIVNATYQGGQPPTAVVNGALAAMKLLGSSIGIVDGVPTTPLFRGQVSYGQAMDEILDHAHVFTVNNTVNVTNPRQGGTGTAVEVNAQTGLVGMPEVTTNSVEFTTLLNPNMQPNSLVHIDEAAINQMIAPAGQQGIGGQQVDGGTQFVNAGYGQPPGWFATVTADGVYTVIVVEHEGDSRGNPWYTHCRSWSGNGIPFSNLYDYLLAPTPGQIRAATNQPNLPPDIGFPGPPSVNQVPGA